MSYGIQAALGQQLAGTPRTLDSLAQAINEAHMIVTMIDNELQRIDARL